MPLSPGTQLGPYAVGAKIGEGGMGEVYQATDTTLDRDVALKVLPAAFTSDPDRLKRFEREAKILASLNHPNIAAIHGLEESDGVRALVLELVDGPTLADRIAQGPIPLDEALPIATQIAEALEAAHEQGVIHRDLKPANIKVREDGTVKVLDFGLAKALDPAPDVDPSQSPTLTAGATQMGVILGTAAYMAPEQAKGKGIDKRVDVWAFGVVLFEMLTGHRLFEGDDVSEVMAGVIKSDPDWALLPDRLSPTLVTYLRRCLTKEPRERLRDIGDMRLAMAGAFETEVSAATVPTPTETVSVRAWQQPWAVALLGVASAVVATLAVWTTMRPDVVPAEITRFVVRPPDPAGLTTGGSHRNLAISPDGSVIVYTSLNESGTGPRLSVQRLDQVDATLLRGGDGGQAPFVSPDGEWVGFVTSGTAVVQKVSVFGGAPVRITESPTGIRGASWGADDRIIFGASGGGLRRVSAGGGESEELTNTERGEADHRWPFIIPGYDAVLFVISPAFAPLSQGQLAVLDLGSGEVIPLGLAGVSPHYVDTGHIVYAAEDGSVRAVAFDPSSLETTGSPVPIIENVIVKPETGAASFDISRDGRLVYVPGSGTDDRRSLVWVDRQGNEEPLAADPNLYESPRVSPDGRYVAVQIDSPEQASGARAVAWLRCWSTTLHATR